MELELQVLHGRERVDGGNDAAGGEGAVESECKLGAVRREKAEHVALLEALTVESRGDVLDSRGELRVRQRAAAWPVDQGGLVAKGARLGEHKAMQRDVRHPHVGIRTAEDHHVICG